MKTTRKNKKAGLVSAILCAVMYVMLFASAPPPVFAATQNNLYDYPQTWVLTGNTLDDTIGCALSQVGYHELGDNYAKYNYFAYDGREYYGSGYGWCGAFVAWCLDQGGVPYGPLKKNSYVQGKNVSNMQTNQYGLPAYAYGKGVAKKGDIIYVENTGDNSSDHVGLVYNVDSNYIYTVEGNCSNSCVRNVYQQSDGRLLKGATDSGSGGVASINFISRNLPVLTGRGMR